MAWKTSHTINGTGGKKLICTRNCSPTDTVTITLLSAGDADVINIIDENGGFDINFGSSSWAIAVTGTAEFNIDGVA